MKKLLPILLVMLLSVITFAQTATPPSAGDGSAANPYQIATLDNLYWLATQVNAGTGYDSQYFIQTADIDATATTGWFSGEGFIPIGIVGKVFNGNYDGQNYKISSLYINRPSMSYIGLFGVCRYITTYGSIKRVKLINVNITGDRQVGALAGCSSDFSIVQCSSSGSINGTGSVGGLVGLLTMQSASIDQSYSNCTVSGTINAIGGLVGYMDTQAQITNCYSTGNVTRLSGSYDYFAAFVGLNKTGSINKCYSTGSVIYTGSSAPQDKGFVGYDYFGTYSNNYFDSQKSNQTSASGATAKTTSDMKTQSTFTGWDFDNTWEIVGNNYPRLKANPDVALPVELTAFTASSTSNGVKLAWSTATEVNNNKFEVERQAVSSKPSAVSQWTKVGEVSGNGNSNSVKNYSFTDTKATAGKYAYRLKQIDNDGTYKYSSEVNVELDKPTTFAMEQNYPNPFNPATVISYKLSVLSNVDLSVYNTLGQKVATLVSEKQEAGVHSVNFNASNLPSGLYIAKINAGSFTKSIKMNLVK